MKKQLLFLAIATSMCGNVYAVDARNVALMPVVVDSALSQSVDLATELNSIDMRAAFKNDAQPLQLAALSGQEMKETQGAFGWLVVLAVANFVWGRTTQSQQDKNVSLVVSSAISYATCGNPIACNPFRVGGRWW